MKRLLSLVLVLVFGLPMVAPVLALGEDAGLPACCRRAGAHHCMGGMLPETGVALRAARCSAYPADAVTARGGDVGLSVGALRFGGMVRHSGVKAQAMARARVAREKARGMRGPPVVA